MLSDLKKRIRELEAELAKKNEEIAYFEKLAAAHDSLGEFARRELMDAERTIEAQENLQILLRQERQDADAIIRAQQNVAELSAMEKQSAEEMIRAHEEISRMSATEIAQRDRALRTILFTGRQLSSILEVRKLFQAIGTSLQDLLGTRQIAIFTHSSVNRLKLAHSLGFDVEQLNGPVASRWRALVEQTAHDRKGHLDTARGALAVPLIHDGAFLGALYAAQMDEEILRARDLEMAEIFALQASVALHNAHLYETIHKRNDELLKLINLKETMAQRITEEIQVPVSTLDRALADLEDRFPTREDMVRLKQTSTRAMRLVNRLCDMKALENEAAQIFSDSIDFEALVQGIFEKHADKVRERGLSLRVSISKNCAGYRANENIMRSIFDELISNAICYNRPGGSVAIQGRRTREHLLFVISDTGVGIAEEDIETVFEQFFRAETSLTLNPAGAGLGLFMVRLFLKHYGGEIQVKSKPGVGTKFILSMLLH